MTMIITAITTARKKTLIPSRFFLCSVPAGDRRAAGEAAGVGAEAGGVRGPAEGSGRAGPEGADGVPGPAGGVGGAPASTAGRQGPADEGHHQQVGRRRAGDGVDIELFTCGFNSHVSFSFLQVNVGGGGAEEGSLRHAGGGGLQTEDHRRTGQSSSDGSCRYFLSERVEKFTCRRSRPPLGETKGRRNTRCLIHIRLSRGADRPERLSRIPRRPPTRSLTRRTFTNVLSAVLSTCGSSAVRAISIHMKQMRIAVELRRIPSVDWNIIIN